MFVVTEAEAAAIRAVYEQRGEFSAAVELRRLFPAVTDTAQARACALGEAAGSGQGSVAPRSAKRSVRQEPPLQQIEVARSPVSGWRRTSAARHGQL